ncbi:chromate efflux transporter [Puniceibacterium sp. IMCC21224]|uniref:chromate efflux transporter n=1 Tax=Puniceibacterium sp. IMCC21224 TaxID=1618204 RepID=UPI00064D7AE2|nr:chromate efflux transporter [Puniceibacterium sp. IMCC21224]KMK66145.1 chromate transporter, chromate ion transporter family [Puniceibacterium sp. IMCC21224]
MTDPYSPKGTVPARESLATFARIGVLSFGGPAAQIALMHKIIVEDKGWLSEQRFLNALSFCMLLPGPEAMQLATYAGWRLHGVRGGLSAGLLFVLPGALVMLALGALYVAYGDVPLMATLFLGVKAAVLAIVLEALLRVSRRALIGWDHWILAGLAFVGIFFLALPYPLIILIAGLYGAFFGRAVPEAAAPVHISLRRTAATVTLGLLIWLLPLAMLDTVTDHAVLSEIGVFFAKLAVVTFGGAYAVLAYMAQDVVTGFGWLSADEMMDGLGLAETTPGPLILVTQFVGYIAAFRAGGYGIALGGAAVTLWVTFVPCFLWIFAGAPYIEWIAAQPRLKGALQAITAAVVGVILNLSVWFGLHVLCREVAQSTIGPVTLWRPELASLDWRAAMLSLLCGVLLLRYHLGIGWILMLSAALGWCLVSAV